MNNGLTINEENDKAVLHPFCAALYARKKSDIT